MKLVGLILISIGFVGGAYIGVIDSEFMLTANSIEQIESSVPSTTLSGLREIQDKPFRGKPAFLKALSDATGLNEMDASQEEIFAAASISSKDIRWGSFGFWFLLGMGGLVLVRIGSRQESHSDEKMAGNIIALETSLKNLAQKVDKLDNDKGNIDTYQMCHTLDEVLIDDLNNFAEARETIRHIYGVQAYADLMSHFAGGERYLNRVWSASADGYIDEVNEYMSKARVQFDEALAKLEALMKQA